MSSLDLLTELEAGIVKLAEMGTAALSVAKEEQQKNAALEQELIGLRQMLHGGGNEVAQRLAMTVQNFHQVLAEQQRLIQHVDALQREIKMLRKVAPHATTKVPSNAHIEITKKK